MSALGITWREAPHRIDEICTELNEPTQREGRILFDYWFKHHRAGGFVVGQHVPHRDIARVLPALSLYETVGGTRDFRVRVAGTAICRRHGRDIKGKLLSELFEPHHFEQHRAQMEHVIETADPFVLNVRATRVDGVPLTFEIVGLKVLASDRKTPWIMTGKFFYSKHAA